MTKDFDARNENKSRSVCAAMAEEADTGKRALSERERRILDMWPRYEDTGDPVMVGDAYIDGSGDCNNIVAVRICDVCVDLVGEDGFLTGFKPGERVKRPATKVLDADGVEVHVGDTVYELETGEEYKVERVFSGAPDPDFPDHAIRCNKVADPIMHVFKPDQLTHRHIVLDADGVEIKVGDTVWHEDGSELHVIGFGDAQNGETMLAVEYAAGPTKWGEVRCLSVIHARPDSWERLEEDASKEPCFYFGFEDKLCGDGAGCPANKLGNCSKLKASDIIRRAKKLAGVER